MPHTLAKDLATHGVDIHKHCHLRAIHDNPDGRCLALTFRNGSAIQTVSARKLVLALPRQAIISLRTDSVIFQDRSFKEAMDAVAPVPCCKIFLAFDKPWWETLDFGPGKVDAKSLAKSHTDLPMQQCYYLGQDQLTGRALMKAAFCDGGSAHYWLPLFRSRVQDCLSSPLPRPAIQEICRQLSESHSISVPEPCQSLFVDWTSSPFGGGWHLWQPGWNSYKIIQKLCRPSTHHDIHVCGEAFSAYQAWVEGALSSAEYLLQTEFGLEPPTWLTSDSSLVAYCAEFDR